MQGIKTPISKVAAALRLRGEGLGLRATARILAPTKTPSPRGNAVLLG